VKKRIIIIALLSFIFIRGNSQISLIIEGKTYINSDTPDWRGVDIPRTVPTLLTFRNNSITSINTTGYMLQSGDDEYYSWKAHNLDNAKISGNKFDWKGTPGVSLCHGIMAGYSINYTIKYNLIEGPFYGIVNEGGFDNGTSMINTGGGIYYNVFKNCPTPILTMGFKNVNIFNNTFYFGISSSYNLGLIKITSSNGTTIPAPSGNIKIKNNIFYSTSDKYAINVENSEAATGFECDYNIYYWESASGNKPYFFINGSTKTWEQWRALGYDTHSVILNPDFIDTETLKPAARLDYGTALGDQFDVGLAVSSGWIVGQYPDSVKQGSVWQVGAKIYASENNNQSPVYQSSVIENVTPSRLEMTYSLALANIIPPVSAFTVTVNSVTRSITSVAVSGTKVQLTLASPAVYGDLVTVGYTKPSSNPLQTASGGEASSLTPLQVTNHVEPVSPVIVFPKSKWRGLINLFPNPNDGRFSIELSPFFQIKKKDINIVSSTGKVVYSAIIAETENFRYFDLSRLTSGIYFLQVTSHNTFVASKIFH
jgi:uncharacterized repeat protein (TIGR02059 family)